MAASAKGDLYGQVGRGEGDRPERRSARSGAARPRDAAGDPASSRPRRQDVRRVESRRSPAAGELSTGERSAGSRDLLARSGQVRRTESRRESEVAAQASSARVGALEGLRAVAIAAIVLYHLSVSWLPSGHLGVVMFFVLTGYLVTCSLMRTWERDGAISPVRFLVRRFKRIWPSMAVVVVVTLAACVAANHILLTKGRPDALPSLLFFVNWHYVASGASYFDQIGGPSPLTHLWYLSVDIQFCLVWVLICWAVMHLGDHRVALRRFALVAALASAVVMGVLFVPGADPSRVYYGLDTRAFSLLAGAWLAFAMPLGTLPARMRDLLWQRRAFVRGREREQEAQVVSPTLLGAALGPVCLVGLLALMVFAQPTAAFMFRGGMVLATILTVGLIASLLIPGTPLGMVLGTRPAVWLGECSFALYLWHYPVFALAGATNGAWWVQLLCVVISLGLAQVSLHVVERPFADGSAAALAADFLEWLRPDTRAQVGSARGAVAIIAAAVCVAFAGTALVGSLALPDEYLVPPDAIRNTGESVDRGMDLTARIQQVREESAQVLQGAAGQMAFEPAAANLPAPEGSIVLHAPAAEVAAGQFDPVLIGDSVPGDAQDYFAQHAPNGLLDAYVGRRPDEMLQVLQDYLNQGVVGHVVVLQAFSNNIPSSEELDQMIAACGPDRQVFLVSVHIPQQEESIINDNITAATERYDNVHLIDWYAYAQGHEADWLYPDMTHLTPDGVAPYIDLITNAVAPALAQAGGTYELEAEAQAAWDAQQQADQQAMLDQIAAGPGQLLQSEQASAQGVVTPLLIGDSVPGDAPFDQVFPNGYMDSYVGRRPEQALSVYQDYANQGVVGTAVVFACFSNTTPLPETLEEIVAAVGADKQIYLVGTVNPDGFQDQANANLQACAAGHDNVHYVDWPAYLAGHEAQWLYQDMTHLTPDGGWAYDTMLQQAIAPQVIAEGGTYQPFASDPATA